MSDKNLPNGWGNQKNNIKPWDSAQNGSPVKSSIQPETENNPPTNDCTQEENKSVYSDKGDKSPVFSSKTTEEKLPTEKKTTEPKTIKGSTVVLAIALTAAICFLIVFAFLYFSGKNVNNNVTESPDKETAALNTEGVTERVTETIATEAPKPTAEPTEDKPKEDNQTTDSFNDYLVWLDVGEIVYEKPYPRSGMTYAIETATNYTIVDETYDEFGNLWGKLKSGIGWVYLSRTFKENEQSSNSNINYLIWLSEGVDVHEQPSPDSKVTYVIDISTKYTIVDEAYDEYGDVWGKLKSGVGWVNLSQLV